MSFTCPSCLWTSAYQQDLENLYCGLCHDFQEYNLEPNPFQKQVIIHLLGRNAAYDVRQVVAQRRRDDFDWTSILEDLLPLATASKLLDEQKEVMFGVVRDVNELRAALE